MNGELVCLLASHRQGRDCFNKLEKCKKRKKTGKGLVVTLSKDILNSKWEVV